jgi:hypothetical protein
MRGRPNQQFVNQLGINWPEQIISNGDYHYVSDNSSYWTDLQSGYNTSGYVGTCGTYSFGTKNGNTTYSPSTGALCNFNLSNTSIPNLSNELTFFRVCKKGTGNNRWFIEEPDNLGPDGLLQVGQSILSRCQFTYNDTTSAGAIQYKLKIAKSSGGLEYNPAANTWYISVGKITAGRVRYFTVNGIGDSGGVNHVSGSYTDESTSSSIGTPTGPRILTQILSQNESAEFGELLVWGTALTQTEIDTVETYLKSRWDITY